MTDALSSDDDDSFLREVAGMETESPPIPLAPGELIGGAYRVVRGAGTGGMGTVYLATDVRSGQSVAIKMLHRAGSARKRFVREAAILAELSHPGIVRYIANGTLDDGAPYLVMDWVEGETLEARLRGKGLTAAESVTVARRVAVALGSAHARGVVHRDIKPSNLIFPAGDPDLATILDFGIARAVAMLGSLTETGAIVGTPFYMSPEQVRGERTIGPAADVFALGCVLYECLAGRRAFTGGRLLALRAKVLLFDPPPIEGVPPELDAAVAGMLAKDPAQRPADGDAVEALLGALVPHALAPRPAPPLVSIVIAAPPETLDERGASPLTHASLDTLRGSVAGTIEPYGATCEVLQDGAMIASLTVTSTPEELALRAARCALALRGASPGTMIGVATGNGGELVDAVVQAMVKDALAMLFPGVASTPLPEGSIRVDARTAALIEHDIELTRIKDAFYFRG